MTEHLKVHASRWYDSLETITFSWAEWKQKLIDAFSDQVEFPSQINKAKKNENP